MIEQVGKTHRFTTALLIEQKAKVEKLKVQLEGQKQIESAKMENVKSFHEIVCNLSDQQLVAIAIYAQAKDVYGQCDQKLKDIEIALKELMEDVEEIEKQTGIKVFEEKKGEEVNG